MQVFDSYIDAGQSLQREERMEFYCAMLEFLKYGVEPEGLDGVVKALWTAIYPSLRISRSKAESGRKGGSKTPSKQQAKQEANGEAIKNTLTNTLTKTTKEEVQEVIEYLNARTGKSFRASSESTTRKVAARLKEGYTVGDFKRVIDNKVKDWANDGSMAKYLRPETLFGTKFEAYLNEGRPTDGGNRTTSADYDW